MNASTTPTNPPKDNAAGATPPTNFIRQIIEEDLKNGKNGQRVATRFPPEPNGYLHIGHAKSICLNFGLARDYKGLCNLRFDDTNPVKEDIEYVNSIQADVEWLGFKWSELLFASDYCEKIYDCAVALIKMGKAYVCDLTADDTREYRGTLTEPGKDSPYRNRSVEENLDLFAKMRNGEFADGSRTLRAKIDMSSPNINMRDPVLYRIKKAHHHRTGDKWCIYPMYDYAHPLSDWIEGITHSLCTLEFEDHRPFYDWVLDTLKDTIKAPARPRQYEFAKLKLDYVVLSKRNLLTLVKDKHVNGWDDPRMPTIQGMRRRGFTPEGLRSFCEKVGVTKKDSCIEFGFLENSIREDLDRNAPRVMGVLKPVKLVIENYPDEQMEEFDVANHPQRPELGTRKVPFSKTLYIELDDFMENPPNKFFRLGPGKEVRLRSAYFVKCTGYHKDDLGRITEIRATYDPLTRGGNSPDGRKVKGTIHWVSAAHALDAEVRIYDRLFNAQFPGTGGVDFLTQMNPHSLETVQAKVERSLTEAKPESRFQFERLGYFCVDRWDSKPEKLVLNRTVTLKDSWAKEKEL